VALLEELIVQPTNTRSNSDTSNHVKDYWTHRIERQMRGTGPVTPPSRPAARSTQAQEREKLTPALRNGYERPSANLETVRLHTGAASDAAARSRAFLPPDVTSISRPANMAPEQSKEILCSRTSWAHRHGGLRTEELLRFGSRAARRHQ